MIHHQMMMNNDDMMIIPATPIPFTKTHKKPSITGSRPGGSSPRPDRTTKTCPAGTTLT